MIGLLVLFGVAAAILTALGTVGGLLFLTRPRRLTLGVALAHGLPGAPTDLGYSYDERHPRTDDGLVIPVWVVEGKAPEGPVVVMTHGWTDSRYGMLTPLQAVGPVASKVWLYDLRGQGESPAKASRLGTTEVEDLLFLLERVKEESPGKPVVLMGFSMGAGISIAAGARACTDPDRYPGIIGVIGDGGYRRGMEPIEGYVRARDLPSWPFLFFIKHHLSFWYSTEAKFDRAVHAAKLPCPLLLLHGQHDLVCPLESVKEIAAAAPNSRIEIFPEASHLDLYATDPDRYESLVQGFIRDVASGTPAQKSS